MAEHASSRARALAGDFALLMASLTLRVGTALVVYMSFARAWGAEAFGQFMYAVSVGAFLVLACEFGFGIQILRDLGRAPASAAELMGRMLAAKLWLTTVTIALALAFVAAVPTGTAVASLLLIATLWSVLASYADFFFAALRALGEYRRETIATLQGNMVFLLFGLLALQWDGRPVVVAGVLVLARLMLLGLALRAFASVVPQRMPIDLRPRAVWPVVRASTPFGAEVAVSALYVNADTVIVTHMLGYAATGVYQAAARFYQGACQLPPVFASLFLPKLAPLRGEPRAMTRAANRLFEAMFATAALCFIAFLALQHLLPWLLPDASLAPAASLMPWFGLLVVVRFVASAASIVTIALDGQVFRVWALSASLLVMVVLAAPMVVQYGPLGMILAAIASHVVLAALFVAWIARRGVPVGRLVLMAQVMVLVGGWLVWMVWL